PAVLLLRRRGVLIEGVLFRPLAIAIHIEGRAPKLVGSGLRDGVDQAARRSAELRGVAGGHDLKLLHRLLRNGEGVVRALAAADAAEERLVVVRPVNADVRIDTALAGERELAALRIDLDRRRQGDEILKAPAIDREIRNR